jgi:transposase
MMNLAPRDPADLAALDALIAAERAAVQRDRLRAVRLSLDGREAADVAAAVGRSRTFVQTWAYRYRDGGLAAVAPRKQPGRAAKLTAGQRAAVRARVLAGPAGEADGGACAFRGEDVRRILAREFGVACSLSAVYDLLRRLRLAPLMPRPRHRKNDPAAADAWLAAAPLL